MNDESERTEADFVECDGGVAKAEMGRGANGDGAGSSEPTEQCTALPLYYRHASAKKHV